MKTITEFKKLPRKVKVAVLNIKILMKVEFQSYETGSGYFEGRLRAGKGKLGSKVSVDIETRQIIDWSDVLVNAPVHHIGLPDEIS